MLRILAVLLLAAVPATAADPFLAKHCVGCHGDERREAGLRLDAVEGITAANRTLWTAVHARVAAGEMPPKSRKLADDERAAFLKRVADEQRALGHATTRRLNRREVGAALRDVTGLTVDFGRALPADGTVAGFDTGAEALQDAADGVDAFLAVSRRAVDAIRFTGPPRGKPFVADLRAAKDPRKELEAWRDAGVNVKGGGIPKPGIGLLLEPKAPGDRDESTFTIPAPADRQAVVRLVVTASALLPREKLPPPRLWVRIGGQDIDFREITGTTDKPQRLVYEVHLADLAVGSKGVGVTLVNKVEMPYAVDGYPNEDKSDPKNPPPGGTGLFRPEFDRKATPHDKWPAPFVVLHALEVDGDYTAVWPPTEWKAGDIGEDAPKLLALWTDRAWRRPSSADERAPFLKLYEQQRAAGQSFADSLRAAFQGVLLAAPFRYLPPPDHANPAIAQHAIASRLSFMLTGSPPDAELRRLAAAGRMRDPAILGEQADRLLADSRSEGFVRPFVTQWLELEQPITIAQAHIQRQDFRFARYLKASMREETIAYFGRLITDDRPASELVKSDWTMMNDTLARHYGYDGIDGGAMRKVTLRPDDPRGGGILGHAGIQSMLCWMGDNWVIYRGAWTLRHVLDHPPPPPPLEVPELNPSDGKNRGKPFRELLRQHQQDAKCAVCHRNIDPVGFAFQNFDLSGRWRDEEFETYSRGELDGRIAWWGVGKTRPVDATGRLPRGEEFAGFAGFKEQVVRHYSGDVARGVAKNLVVWGAGRPPDIDDSAEIAAILTELKPAGYPLRRLVKAVVRSNAFLGTQTKRPE